MEILSKSGTRGRSYLGSHDLGWNTNAERKRIWVEAYGCSASMADSERIKGILISGGYDLVSHPNQADLNLIVTCGVKESTEHHMLSRIKSFAAGQKPLVIAGCLPKADQKLVENSCPTASLLGPHSLDMTLDVVKDCFQGKKQVAIEDSKTDKVGLPSLRINKVVGIVQISSGCLSNCSFCQTKLAKGDLRSYRIGDIVRDVNTNVYDGCKEIWLTSTDNGCYGYDIQTDLVHLLEALDKISGNFKIRVGMMNPMYLPRFGDRLIRIYMESHKLFKFLHIPVQSGSERILRMMKRGHTAMIYRRIVDSFRKYMPEITIATDVIVGFPSESEEDFQRTLDLMRETKPDVVNISKYSPRPGTRASKLSRIDSSVVTSRTNEMHKMVRAISSERNEAWMHWRGDIIIDEVNDKFIQGRNYAYKPVVLTKLPGSKFFENDRILGSLLEVRIDNSSNFCLKGSVIT
ncbi:MAG TPA: tRNA (N(6)-L-threonylcarbamoyladenosine(37)-C(2))-methylthiotransferase [Nitrososphaeraceae archaeon]|jgi:MiaB-like tRNA modifying enzyme